MGSQEHRPAEWGGQCLCHVRYVSGNSANGTTTWKIIPVDIMLVPNIPKEPDLALRHKHRHTQRMNRCISKPLVVEPATSIQPVEILLICFPTEVVQVTDFEVREELAIVVVAAVVWIKEPVQISFRMDELWMCIDEGACARPERRK